jgi:hypothetical protein
MTEACGLGSRYDLLRILLMARPSAKKQLSKTLQSAVLEYQYSAKPYFDDDSSFYRATMALSLSFYKTVS